MCMTFDASFYPIVSSALLQRIFYILVTWLCMVFIWYFLDIFAKFSDTFNLHQWKDLKNQQISGSNSEFSAHVSTDHHRKEDPKYCIICSDFVKRGIKEAIPITKQQLNLNKDDVNIHTIHTSKLFQGHVWKRTKTDLLVNATDQWSICFRMKT